MKTKLFLCLLLALPTLSHAFDAAEVLRLNAKTPKTFLVSNSQGPAIIELKNELTKVKISLACDNQHSETFTLKENKKKNITIKQSAERCVLKAQNLTVYLIKDEKAFPFLRELNNNVESCSYQSSARHTDKLFLTNSYPMLSCIHAAEAADIEILPLSSDGLLSKMEALLGYKPSVDFIKNMNPYAALDFSRAPKLKAIFVSTLLYRNDFTGSVIARLLKFHALRGTLVNIIGTGYMHEEKDKKLLKELALFSPNIRIQEYKFIDPSPGVKNPMRYLDNHFRDMHVKLFVTLSDSPKDNVVIVGGRNIHDGFVFSTKPDLSKFPELDQAPEGAWAFWQDLEIKITSTEVAESSYTHLLKLWNRKIKGQVVRDISDTATEINGDGVLNSNSVVMRHFLSLPFNDQHALEKLYVDMIDKAQKSIKLSSPYLRPTKAIMAAFERAIKREVDITIQTRINLEGDTQAWLYEETNKAAINSLFEKVKIYEWSENSILHTKMIIVDEKFAFFGSVNLSRRSFIQDVESGFLINSEDFVARLNKVFDGYQEKSRRISTKQKRKLWASILVNIFQDQF